MCKVVCNGNVVCVWGGCLEYIEFVCTGIFMHYHLHNVLMYANSEVNIFGCVFTRQKGIT